MSVERLELCGGRAVIYRGDCREVLPTLGRVDCVVTDPPYGIKHSSGRGASWIGTTIHGDEDTRERDEVIAWCESAGLPWCAFGTWKVPTPTAARGVIVWDKGPASGMGDLSFPWKASWEEIAIGGRGWEGSRGEGVLRGHIVVSWESKGRTHPNEKPVSLVMEILNKLPNAVVVLDPFMGSGTTGVAAIQTGRRFIGIEIDKGYFEIARDRIARAEKPLTYQSPKIVDAPLFVGGGNG